MVLNFKIFIWVKLFFLRLKFRLNLTFAARDAICVTQRLTNSNSIHARNKFYVLLFPNFIPKVSSGSQDISVEETILKTLNGHSDV